MHTVSNLHKVVSSSHQAQYCPPISGSWGKGWGREGRVAARHSDRPQRLSLMIAFSAEKGVGEGGGVLETILLRNRSDHLTASFALLMIRFY